MTNFTMTGPNNVIINTLHNDAGLGDEGFEKLTLPLHFFPGAPVEVNGVLEYPVILHHASRIRVRGGEEEEDNTNCIGAELCVTHSVETQMLIAICLSHMMEFYPEEFGYALEYARKQYAKMQTESKEN